ncbi:hypothetical protein [Streptomyces sp. NPDC012466]
MSTAINLGEFLRTRRSLLHLEDVALPDFGGRRQVTGLPARRSRSSPG